MKSSAEVMAKLRQTKAANAYQAAHLLESGKLKPIASGPAEITASEALRLWRTRLRTSQITKKKFPGLEAVVHRLADLTPQKKVDQFGYAGNGKSLTILFEKTSGEYLGAIIVAKS